MASKATYCCLRCAAVLISTERMDRVARTPWFPRLICAAMFAALALAASAKDKKKEDKKAEKAAAEALLAKSRGLSNIEEPGSPPFVLNAKIRYQIGSQSADGHAQIIWLAPDHYREAFSAPNYFYTEIVRDGYRYLSRTNDDMPLMIYELERTFRHLLDAGLAQKEKIKNLEKTHLRDESLTCVTFADKSLFERCFTDDGDVASMERHAPADDTLRELYEFSNFVVFGPKRFPQTIVFRGGDDHVLQIDVGQLESMKEPPAGAFVLPPDTTKETWCAQPKTAGPDLQKEPFSLALDPGPMMDAERSLIAYHPALYIVVGPNGHVRNGTVIRSSRPLDNNELKHWMSNMRFPILQCGHDGIEYQMELQF